MPGIRVREGESSESALRRFRRAVEKSGTLAEVRRREFFEPPSKRKKRAMAAAVKRRRKQEARERKGDRDGGSRGGYAGRH